MNDRQKEVLIRWIMLGVALLLLIIFAAEGISNLGNQKIDTTEGLELLAKAESADITAIENKIAGLEASSNTVTEDGEEEPVDTRSTKEKFASTVIMGDSIALGFSEYDVLNSSSVVAEIGIKISEEDKVKVQIEAAKAVNPQMVVLCYGINDIKDGVSVEEFVNSYKERLDYIKEVLPDTKIFVSSIFPVQPIAAGEEENYKNIEVFNEELRAACDKKQIAFMDNTELPGDNDYAEDGIHFVADFYDEWAEEIAEVAEL